MSNESINLQSDDFEVPVNVKQIGCVDEESKIYIEDYVYTYLYQYAKTNGNKEKVAYLVGRKMVIDGKDLVIISGAIQGKYTEKINGTPRFTELSLNYANEKKEKYFKGLDIIGWLHTRPGFGTYLTGSDVEYHISTFGAERNVFMIIDSLEKTDAFFIKDSNTNTLRDTNGYFVYYAKNPNMQDYMIDNSIVSKKTDEEKVSDERIDAAKKIRRVLNDKKDNERISINRYRALTAVSGFLCVTCIMMGASLVNNNGKIDLLEKEILTVKTSYSDISKKLEEQTVKSVFANDPSVGNASAEVKETEETNKNEQIKPEDKKEEKTPTFISYKVKAGDTLGIICSNYYGDDSNIDDIVTLNKLKDADTIYVGATILLPEK